MNLYDKTYIRVMKKFISGYDKIILNQFDTERWSYDFVRPSIEGEMKNWKYYASKTEK